MLAESHLTGRLLGSMVRRIELGWCRQDRARGERANEGWDGEESEKSLENESSSGLTVPGRNRAGPLRGSSDPLGWNGRKNGRKRRRIGSILAGGQTVLSELSEQMDDRRKIAQYEILEKLGEGGM